MQGTYMRVELPPDLADQLKKLAKILKCPVWRVIERSVQKWVVEDEEPETLPREA